MPPKEGPLRRRQRQKDRLYALRVVILATLLGLISYFAWIKPYRSALSDVSIVHTQP